jgi:hypothetical protein
MLVAGARRFRLRFSGRTTEALDNIREAIAGCLEARALTVCL